MQQLFKIHVSLNYCPAKVDYIITLVGHQASNFVKQIGAFAFKVSSIFEMNHAGQLKEVDRC
jgi:hypothetical protein